MYLYDKQRKTHDNKICDMTFYKFLIPRIFVIIPVLSFLRTCKPENYRGCLCIQDNVRNVITYIGRHTLLNFSLVPVAFMKSSVSK